MSEVKMDPFCFAFNRLSPRGKWWRGCLCNNLIKRYRLINKYDKIHIFIGIGPFIYCSIQMCLKCNHFMYQYHDWHNRHLPFNKSSDIRFGGQKNLIANNDSAALFKKHYPLSSFNSIDYRSKRRTWTPEKAKHLTKLTTRGLTVLSCRHCVRCL